MTFASTGPSKVRSLKCCILFDVSDGTIQHVHHVVTMEDVQEPDEHVVETRTLDLAKSLGVDVSRLKPLHVDPTILEENREYQVDVRTRSLVPKDERPPKSGAC
jgi:hypothetical protein